MLPKRISRQEIHFYLGESKIFSQSNSYFFVVLILILNFEKNSILLYLNLGRAINSNFISSQKSTRRFQIKMNLIKQLVYVQLDFIFYDYKNDIDRFIDGFSLSTGTPSLDIHML